MKKPSSATINLRSGDNQVWSLIPGREPREEVVLTEEQAATLFAEPVEGPDTILFGGKRHWNASVAMALGEAKGITDQEGFVALVERIRRKDVRGIARFDELFHVANGEDRNAVCDNLIRGGERVWWPSEAGWDYDRGSSDEGEDEWKRSTSSIR